MKKLHLIAAFCFFFFLSAVKVYAQTSDRCAYYILYDRSGSVKFLDRNHNLVSLLNELLQVSARFDPASKRMVQQKVNNQPPDFNIFFFGGNSRQSLRIGYQTALDQKRTDQIIKSVEDTAIVSKNQPYTYIHTALLDVIHQIKQDDKQATRMTAGVFLFTDGQLNEKDFQPFGKIRTVQQYYQYIHQLIGQVETLTGKPVFLIQTSRYLQNPYYPATNTKAATGNKPRGAASFLNDSTYFWLSSGKKFDETPKDQQLIDAYDNFIDHANELIVSSNKPLIIDLKDSVSKLLAVQDIVNLKTEVKLAMGERTSGRLDSIFQDGSNATVNRLLAILKIGNDSAGTSRGTENGNLMITAAQLNSMRKDIKLLTSAQLSSVKNGLSNILKENIDKVQGALPTISADAFSPGPQNMIDDKTKTAASSGSLEQNLINGAADYIIDRARQEAVYAFLENIKDQLFSDGRLQSLFPETYIRLKDSTNYFDLNIVKQAFIRDMDQLPANITVYTCDTTTAGSRFFADPRLLAGLVTIQKLYTDMTTDGSLELSLKGLAAVLKDIPFDVDPAHVGPVPIRDGLIFTSNLIGYLTDNNLIEVFAHNERHIDLDALSKLLVVMALDDRTIQTIQKIDLSKAYNIVKTVYVSYQSVTGQLKTLQANIEGKLPAGDFEGFRKFQTQSAIDIFYRATEVVQSGFQVLDQLHYTSFFKPHLAYMSADTMKKAVDAFFMLKQGNYSQAAFLLSPMIVNAVFAGNNPVMEKKREYCNQLISIAGDVSAATSSEDIKKIMAKYALPVASYRLKRASAFTVMVNAYAGLGYNYFDRTKESRFAISTPIGLEVSHKAGKTQSVSVLLSLFDLGNIVSSRLWNPSSADEQNVKLEHIVSPGLYLIYGPFKKIPLSFYAGYAFNPNRFNISVSLDLPLFAIYKSN